MGGLMSKSQKLSLLLFNFRKAIDCGHLQKAATDQKYETFLVDFQTLCIIL